LEDEKMKIKSVFLVVILAAVLCISGNLSAACPSADLTGDCVVNLADLAKMAEQWLTEGTPTPILYGMTWVSINDPGVSGHGGFIGEMSKYETTNAQYCQFLNAAKASNQITVYNNVVYATSDTSHSHRYFYTYAADSHSQITYSGGVFSIRTREGYSMANHPVVMVNWYGATAFCNYYGYRLPTEWEWQAVADYDGSYTYGCGTTINQNKVNYWDNVYANPLGLTSEPYTSPVGYYPAYGYGMCDMAGNVLEWTSSCYYSDCSYSSRVFRGGGWGNSDYGCTVSGRGSGSPNSTSDNFGFRVCR
jgi:formylglycine-generating enzyme required for sulfatase activity